MPINFTIIKYQTKYKSEVISIWEKSVLFSHHFLIHEDFIAIKNMLIAYDFASHETYCLQVGENLAGFIEIQQNKVEMLFLDPLYIGKGYGKYLLQFAIDNCHAIFVNVNEQNINARYFYEKLGFEVFERSDKDGFGKDYPLLKMKIKSL